MCIECSSFQIDLTPSLDPSIGILLNITPDHLDRHGSMANYAAVKERLITGVAQERHRDRRRRRRLVPGDRRPSSPRRRQRGPGLGAAAAGRRRLCRGRASCAATGGTAARDRRCSAASARCAAGTMRRTPPAPIAAALALGLDARAIADRPAVSFPGLAHRMEEVGRNGRVLFVNDSKATNADAAAQALACFPTSTGSPAASPRPAASRPGGLLSAHPQGLSDRRGGSRTSPATLDGKAPYVVAGTLERAVAEAARDAGASGADQPSCCCRRPAPLRPVREFRGARRRVPRTRAQASGRHRAGAGAGCSGQIELIS